MFICFIVIVIFLTYLAQNCNPIEVDCKGISLIHKRNNTMPLIQVSPCEGTLNQQDQAAMNIQAA